jgi:molybdopterin synthase catalytic subunit
MSVHIAIVEGPIASDTESDESAHGSVGAVLIFDGVVRAIEEGRRLAALSYEVYQPMAGRQLAMIGEQVAQRHGLISLSCWHSRGRVNVDRASLRVVIRAAHRQEALAAMGEFIDRLKRDVPIWKSPVWAE